MSLPVFNAATSFHESGSALRVNEFQSVSQEELKLKENI
jgi:hypothetical protein